MNSSKKFVLDLVLLSGFLSVTYGSQLARSETAFSGEAGGLVAHAIAKAPRVKTPQSSQNSTTATRSPSGAIYIESEKVAAAISKGGVLYDGNADEKNYEVHIGRDEKAKGQAATHKLTTHIIYVLDGSATYVTGGTLVDAKTVAPNEVRGSAIEGGETHHLAKGEILIVPNGVPHQIKEVQGPFIRYEIDVH
jgi:quercetin dioxygenase-like cupin family protein